MTNPGPGDIAMRVQQLDKGDELYNCTVRLVQAALEYRRLLEADDADAYDARCALWAAMKPFLPRRCRGCGAVQVGEYEKYPFCAVCSGDPPTSSPD